MDGRLAPPPPKEKHVRQLLRSPLARARQQRHRSRMRGFPDPTFINAGGVRLATYQAGEKREDRPPVILAHGWPELGYSWKHQLPALAAAGWRAIAIDLKGFGASDAPADKSRYDSVAMTDDFVALLDALGEDRAVFCGHDWGGALIWSMGQLRPERVAGLIGVSTPLRKRAPAAPLEIIARKVSPDHYFIRFQEEGVVETQFEAEIERFFAFMFRKPAPRRLWPRLIPEVYDIPARFAEGKHPAPDALVMGEEDLGVYIDAYRRSGFRGGINLYRNIDRNWSLMAGRDEIVRAPSLWVGADLDLFLPPESAEEMDSLVPDLEKRILSDCGHWVMWEKPDKLNNLMIDWLQRRIR